MTFSTYKLHVCAIYPVKNVCIHWITCPIARDLESLLSTMAEKKEKKDLLGQEKKKSWTYNELVVATGGGEF